MLVDPLPTNISPPEAHLLFFHRSALALSCVAALIVGCEKSDEIKIYKVPAEAPRVSPPNAVSPPDTAVPPIAVKPPAVPDKESAAASVKATDKASGQDEPTDRMVGVIVPAENRAWFPEGCWVNR